MTKTNSISAAMIRNNYKLDIASLDVGAPGTIYVSQSKQDIWNRVATFWLKVTGCKRHKLLSVSDSMPISNVKDLLEEYINSEFVTKWQV